MSSNELFYCPITGDVMEDPYIDKEGHTYEKTAIQVSYKLSSLATPTITKYTFSS